MKSIIFVLFFAISLFGQWEKYNHFYNWQSKYGINLVKNYDFSNGEDSWTLVNSSIVDAHCEITGTTSTDAYIYQYVNVTNGKKYLLTYYIIYSNNAGLLYLSSGSFTTEAITLPQGIGYNKIEIKCLDDTKPLKIITGYHSGLVVHIDNIKLRQVK